MDQDPPPSTDTPHINQIEVNPDAGDTHTATITPVTDEELPLLTPEDANENFQQLVGVILPSVLTTLIENHDTDPFGKQLLADIKTLYGVELSTGHIYPTLHQLEDDDILDSYELESKRHYRINDSEAAHELITTSQHELTALQTLLSPPENI